MTKYRITFVSSVCTTANAAHAFDLDGPGPDTLTVDPDAFLRAEGSGAFGARLAGTGAWTVRVDGSVVSADSIGIRLMEGNPAASSVAVGANGKVGGAGLGIAAYSPVAVDNDGLTAAADATGVAIYLDGAGANTIANAGTIDGATLIRAQFGTGAERVTNSGVMNGRIHLGAGDDRLANTGQVNGKRPGDALDLGDGPDTLVNKGAIRMPVVGGDGNDTVGNGGFIGGDVLVGAGADNLFGDAGNGRFDHTARSHGRDTIGGFSNLAGNNDALGFAGAAFGGLPAGALAAGRFVANAAGAATTLDQRFIYETDAGILRFDANGSAASGVTVIAALTGAPVLTAADIVIL